MSNDDSKSTATNAASELREISQGRSQIYQLFASLYFKELTDDQIRFFADEALPMLEGVDDQMAEGARIARSYLRRVTSMTREELAVDYAHTFLAAGSTKGEKRACPFESIYTSEEGLLMQEARDGVYRAMLGEHLEPDPDLHVPEDHLSFMFQFMAHVTDAMVVAFESGDVPEAKRLLDVARTFHAEHLLNWIDTYREAVLGCCRTDFYRGVAMMTCDFVHMDTDLMTETAELLG